MNRMFIREIFRTVQTKGLYETFDPLQEIINATNLELRNVYVNSKLELFEINYHHAVNLDTKTVTPKKDLELANFHDVLHKLGRLINVSLNLEALKKRHKTSDIEVLIQKSIGQERNDLLTYQYYVESPQYLS